MELDKEYLHYAVEKLLAYAEKKGDKKLEKLIREKLNLPAALISSEAEEPLDIVMEHEKRFHQVQSAERRLIEETEQTLKEKIEAWMGLTAFSFAINDLAKKYKLSDDEVSTLLSGLQSAAIEIEGEIPGYFTLCKAFKEYGYEAHNITLKDVSLFLVPLIVYILLERR
jgi:hypothetical protein